MACENASHAYVAYREYCPDLPLAIFNVNSESADLPLELSNFKCGDYCWLTVAVSENYCYIGNRSVKASLSDTIKLSDPENPEFGTGTKIWHLSPV